MALSRDSVEENKKLVEKNKLDFIVVSDPDLGQVTSLGMVHPKAGPGGKDVARPATYIIGRDGVVKWFHTAGNIRVRPDPADVLAAAK